MVPLVPERLSRNIVVLCNSLADVAVEGGLFRKLYSDTCKELARMADIFPTFREEEAGPETTLLKVFASDGAGYCGLSRSSQAVQPEDAPLVLSISPVEYVPENVDAGVVEARGFVLPLVRIERCFNGVR